MSTEKVSVFQIECECGKQGNWFLPDNERIFCAGCGRSWRRGVAWELFPKVFRHEVVTSVADIQAILPHRMQFPNLATRDALENLWAAAVREGVLPQFVSALLYVAQYAHGVRIFGIENGENGALSFEFSGLDKDGQPFIHIGAIYRPDSREWSFHS